VSCADHGYGRGGVFIYISVSGSLRSPSQSSEAVRIPRCWWRQETTRSVRVWCSVLAIRSGYKCAGERWSFDAGTESAWGFYMDHDSRRFPRFAVAALTASVVTSRRCDNFGMHDRKRYRHSRLHRRRTRQRYVSFYTNNGAYNRELEDRTSPSADRFTWPAGDLELLCYAISSLREPIGFRHRRYYQRRHRFLLDLPPYTYTRTQ
jgi:hypothetical protein